MKTKLTVAAWTVAIMAAGITNKPAHAYSQTVCSLGYGVAICGARSVNPSAKIIQVAAPRRVMHTGVSCRRVACPDADRRQCAGL